jgi:hypothetical protein
MMPAPTQKPATRRVLAPAPGWCCQALYTVTSTISCRPVKMPEPRQPYSRPARSGVQTVAYASGDAGDAVRSRTAPKVRSTAMRPGCARSRGPNRSQSLSMAYEPMTPRTAAARTV